MNRKLLPHFLIIGAPKCGTTALHYYLSQHPDVNLSPKEIHYFGKDIGYGKQYWTPFKTNRVVHGYFNGMSVNGGVSRSKMEKWIGTSFLVIRKETLIP